MKKLLILGASGFTGRNLMDFFQNKSDYTIECPLHSELDALDENALCMYLFEGKFDVVLNCLDSAAGEGFFERRVRMFANLAHHSDLYGKMIYFGSGAEYGRQMELDGVKEEYVGRAVPSDSYGLALYLINHLARNSRNIYNIRLFGIFGKYEIYQQRFISNAICKKLYGYPITIRQDRAMSYTDVSDLALVTEWMINNTPKYHDYNLVQGKPFLLSELADMVNKQDRNKVPVYTAREGMSLKYSGDGTRLFNECGIKFRSMEDSVSGLYKWYKERLDTIDKEALLYQ